MNPQSVLKRSDNATFEVVADEAILIHLETGTYFSLNKVGTEFWEMLDGQTTVQDHAAVIASQYDVDVDIVIDDLIELGQEMAAEDLVAIVQP